MIDPTNDTSPEAAAVQLELVRRMSGTERLGRTIDLTSQMIRMSKNAIRRRFPEIPEAEVGFRFIELHYGKELADEVRKYCNSKSDTEAAN